MGAHTTSDDPTRYRLAGELEAWKLKDPIERVKAYLSRSGIADQAFFDELEAEADELAAHVREGCLDDARPASRCRCSTTSTPTQHPLLDEERAQFAAYLDVLRGRAPTDEHETLTLAKALNTGLRRAMEDDPKVLIMGEDVGKLGGVFRVTDGLQKDFGEDRVIDTPLAESGIIGTAIGLAMRGYRPVCEIQFDGFVYPAFDQIVSQVAKMRDPLAGQGADADRHPHPVRRRHRRGRAPQRVARGLLRAHRRPARSSPAPTRPTPTG